MKIHSTNDKFSDLLNERKATAKKIRINAEGKKLLLDFTPHIQTVYKFKYHISHVSLDMLMKSHIWKENLPIYVIQKQCQQTIFYWNVGVQRSLELYSGKWKQNNFFFWIWNLMRVAHIKKWNLFHSESVYVSNKSIKSTKCDPVQKKFNKRLNPNSFLVF